MDWPFLFIQTLLFGLLWRGAAHQESVRNRADWARLRCTGKQLKKIYSTELLLEGLNGLDIDLGVSKTFVDTLLRQLLVLKQKGHQHVIFILYDSGRGLTVQTQICSFKQNGLVGENLIFVALDDLSRTRAAELGVETIGFKTTRWFLTKKRKFWLKLLFTLFVLRTDLTCFLLDSDVILLGNFYDLWNDEWDFELASDNMNTFFGKEFEPRSPFQANSGLMKMKPTEGLKRLIGHAALQGRVLGKPDQDLVNHELRKSRKFEKGWIVPDYNVTWNILEPLIAPTGGVLFCRGRERLRKLAIAGNVTSPTIVHLNYHVPGNSKGRTTRLLGWKVQDRKCPNISWPYWTTANFPNELKCVGPYVRDVDPWDK